MLHIIGFVIALYVVHSIFVTIGPAGIVKIIAWGLVSIVAFFGISMVLIETCVLPNYHDVKCSNK